MSLGTYAISPGDEGGPMTNGANYAGTSYGGGDLDMWSFSATAGAAIRLGIQETTDTNFNPCITLFGPDGTQLTSISGSYSAIANATAPSTGTYIVVVSSTSSGSFSAQYVLTLAMSPGPYAISPGDEGGSMTNGVSYPGTSYGGGDVDMWSFSATAGAALRLQMQETTDTNFDPSITLFAPDGTQLGYQAGSYSATVSATASSTGTYTVFAGSSTSGSFSAKYTLTLSGGDGNLPPQSGKLAGSQASTPGCACAADPITLSTGNVFEQSIDYKTAGQNPLVFAWFYNSLGNQELTFASTLGVNWRSTFDRYLRINSSSSVIAERPDGQQLNFTLSGSVWTPDSDVDMTLTQSGGTWTLTDHDDTVETYTATGSEAVLNSIRLRNGYTQNLTYTSGLLHTVTDSYDRSLTLNYSGGLLNTVSTPDTLVLTYGFTVATGGNVLTSVAYNTSPATSITYAYGNASFPFALTSLTDENSNLYSSWTYDSQGRATENWLGPTATPRINDTQISYDDATGNRTVTGPLGIAETYKFTTLQGVPKVNEIDRAADGTVTAATRLFTYDSNGYQNTATDWDGNLTRYTNNSHGQPTEIDEAVESAVARSTYLVYDTTWVHLPYTITTPGLTSTLNYDTPTGNLLTRVDADTTSQTVPYTTNGQTRTTTYTWTATGQLQTVQLPRTDVTAKTTYGYTGGTLTSITDALGHATNVTGYTGGGLPQTVTDPNSVLTTLAYDGRLRLNTSVLTVSGGALTTTYTHDAAENLTKVTLPDGSYLAYTYDNAHRVTQIENKLNQPIPLTLDAKGDTTQTLWENASGVVKRQHSATFDALGRMLTDGGGVGQTTTYGYDSQGNVTSITDPLNNVTGQTPDALNRLQTITDPLKHTTGYSYDAHDRPLTVTDPNGHATSFVYDGFGEAIQQTSPDTGTTVYRYDPDGNLTSKTDAGSVVTNYSYDADDRPLTRTYPADTTLNVFFTYDQAGSHGKGVGRLTSVVDATGTLSLTYDARGNLLTSARVLGGATYTTSYSYDNANRVSSITYPKSGWLVGYTRDSAGEITAVSAKPPTASGHTVASAIAHLPYGPPSSLTWGNGVADLRAFDKDYRMTQVADTGAALLLKLTYGYYADNSVYTITDGVTAANDQTFGYDPLRRLTGARGSYGSHSYTYDNNGAVLQRCAKSGR